MGHGGATSPTTASPVRFFWLHLIAPCPHGIAPAMDSEKLIDSLNRFGHLLPGVVAGVTEADSRWKPSASDWSLLEIVSHLADEEALDFRFRLQLILSNPNTAWPPIDPEGWAVERRYNEGKLPEAVERFCRLRTESVAWLRTLKNPDWNATYQHPEFGPFRAGDLFASWGCHDCLHLRQISKRLYQLTLRDAGDYTARYAGEWGA